MPSPVGHALGGIAAGRCLAPRGGPAAVWTLAAIGAAADLDLLLRMHRGPAHSLGAALIAGAVAFAVTRSARWGGATLLAWGSHVVLDWLGEDTWPPIGIPALWPFSRQYFQSAFVLFPSVSRQYWRDDFVYYNAKALLVELIVLLPITVIVVLRCRRSRFVSGAHPSHSCPPPAAGLHRPR